MVQNGEPDKIHFRGVAGIFTFFIGRVDIFLDWPLISCKLKVRYALQWGKRRGIPAMRNQMLRRCLLWGLAILFFVVYLKTWVHNFKMPPSWELAVCWPAILMFLILFTFFAIAMATSGNRKGTWLKITIPCLLFSLLGAVILVLQHSLPIEVYLILVLVVVPFAPLPLGDFGYCLPYLLLAAEATLFYVFLRKR